MTRDVEKHLESAFAEYLKEYGGDGFGSWTFPSFVIAWIERAKLHQPAIGARGSRLRSAMAEIEKVLSTSEWR